MISIREFLLRARLDRRLLEAWISAGWLASRKTDSEPTFSEWTSLVCSSYGTFARTLASTMRVSR